MHDSLCSWLFYVACLPFSITNSPYQFADKEFLASAFFEFKTWSACNFYSISAVM